ncbi:MAG: PepSY domain-containing protein [Phycisphaerae bacterium]|nr:PepSY domain-containing protein [Phycisphaerae bacterium]
MKHYKLNRTVHKWLGIIFAIAFLEIAVTGLLLLEKKNYNWIQPETKKGSEGGVEDFITNQKLFEVVLAAGHKDFSTMDDIDRVDFRPGKRVFKVQSKHNYREIQVDAVNNDILSIATRNSDMIEALHDGSYFGEFVHRWLMRAFAVVTVVLTITGLYLWLAPALKKAKRQKA